MRTQGLTDKQVTAYCRLIYGMTWNQIARLMLSLQDRLILAEDAGLRSVLSDELDLVIDHTERRRFFESNKALLLPIPWQEISKPGYSRWVQRA